MANYLEEYLIRLGFDVDRATQSKMRDAVREGALQANLLATALEGAFGKIATMVAATADQMADLYYASRRTKDTVANIEAIGRAAERTGSSVGEARSALEGFARFLRTNPGGNDLARQFAGIDPKHWNKLGNSDKLKDMIKGLKDQPYAVQAAYQQLFGIPEKFWLAVSSGEFDKQEERQRSILRAAGLDPEQAARDMRQFKNELSDFSDTLDTVFQRIAGQFVHGGGGAALKEFDQWLIDHSREIGDGFIAIVNGLNLVIKDLTPYASLLNKVVESTIGWTRATEGLALVMASGMVANVVKLAGALTAIAGLKMPGWFLGLVGLGGSALALNEQVQEKLTDTKGPLGLGQRFWNDLSAEGGAVRRAWRNRPTWLGGTGTQVAKPGAAGTYRPQYPLGAADLSDAVVNTIAGEARTKDPKSVDAVIDNMFNRLGTHAYGPSGNLEQVARAPGQYAGYRRASPAEAAFIRDRIRAIASGGVPDITNGANEYRAGWYSGPWGWLHRLSPVIGGNRFAYNPRVAAGPYAPYADPKVPGASSPSAFGSLFGVTPALGAPVAAPSATPFGTMNLDSYRKLFQTPLGAPAPGSIDNSSTTTSAPVLHQKTSINLYGVGDGHEELGAKIGRAQHNVNAQIIRNLQGASVA